MTESKRYNGWTNYETWCVHLWLTNDQGSHEVCREAVLNALDDCEECDGAGELEVESEDAEAHSPCAHCDGGKLRENLENGQAAETLKEMIDDPEHGFLPDLGATMAADLLGAAMSEVNWQEIAEAFAE